MIDLQRAIDYLRDGDWQAAHEIVQDDPSSLAAWAHAIVHLQEGDESNARYWFQRVPRAFSEDVDSELDALAVAVNQSA